MTGWRTLAIVCVGAAALLWAGTSLAVEPGPKCEALKNRTAGKLGFCINKAIGKFVKTGDGAKAAADILKCDAKFSSKWTKAEEKGAGECPTEGDQTLVGNFVACSASVVSSVLSGSTGGTCSLCPGGGVLVGGFCWHLGATNASCDATCAGAGLVYDAATDAYAGGGGSLAQCYEVLDALGQVSPPLNNYGDAEICAAPWGCFVDVSDSNRVRCASPPANATASNLDFRRACACQ